MDVLYNATVIYVFTFCILICESLLATCWPRVRKEGSKFLANS